MFFLSIYTRHGQSLAVPDFKGMPIDEAYDLAHENSLKIVVTDSIFRPALPAGSVIDQNPKPDARVKKKRKVFITINCVMPKKIDAPNVVGFSLRQGKAVLESKGLKIGKLIYQPDMATNNILDQRYKGRMLMPNEPVFVGTSVDLVLGMDNEAGERTSIPYVLRLNSDDARSRLADASLNLGRMRFDKSVKTISDSLSAVVYKQVPGPSGSNSTSLGSSVDIYLTVDESKIPK